MIQRDKNIRGLLLERLLDIPFHHPTLKIFVLYLRIVLLAETFKQYFYRTKHLCYLYIELWCALDLLVYSHVGISLQITDCAAPLAACTFHQSEVGELICGGIVQ